MKDSEKPVIGWREWVSLPVLGIPNIKAKVDSGARTSSLHAFDVHIIRRHGVAKVRFKVHPMQRDTSRTIECEARLAGQRWVKASGGHETQRPVIETEINLAGQRRTIEVTLAGRSAMGFRMLLGRQAIRNHFVIDPGRSFLCGKQPVKRMSVKKDKTQPFGHMPPVRRSGESQ